MFDYEKLGKELTQEAFDAATKAVMKVGELAADNQMRFRISLSVVSGMIEAIAGATDEKGRTKLIGIVAEAMARGREVALKREKSNADDSP